MISSVILIAFFWLAAFLVVYHHAIFPIALRVFAERRRKSVSVESATSIEESDLPSVTIVVPAYNEAAYIRQKIANIAALDYPADKLSVFIGCDGCTDATEALALEAFNKEEAAHLKADVKGFTKNRGKIAVLNELIADAQTDIVVLSDVSAIVEKNALRKMAARFEERDVGVVCGTYALDESANAGEQLYWDYQRAVKRDEAEFGSPMGAHGAFYAIRRGLYLPMPADTINDDFIIPLRIVGLGYRAVYETSIVARELETSANKQDFNRRIRISAGNMQQIFMLGELFSLKRPALAFVFGSGKALRAFTPFLLAMMVFTSALLTLQGDVLHTLAFAGLLGLGALGSLQIWASAIKLPRILQPFAYFAAGHMASFVGGVRFLTGLERGHWSKASETIDGVAPDMPLFDGDFVSPMSRRGKRIFDIMIASCAMVVLVLVFPIVALIIKLESKGPILYRQLRVGVQTEKETKLFLLNKFRSMGVDAEAKSGAVWAAKNDPRVTRFGGFMRKTRIDELPQAWNVLVGDMSIVGPRPERPVFFAKLEKEIPFYTERTYGLKPGITGLAQVTTGYDESVEDVRQKVLHDHVYSTRIVRPWEWFFTDFSICLRTFTVMVTGKGQ